MSDLLMDPNPVDFRIEVVDSPGSDFANATFNSGRAVDYGREGIDDTFSAIGPNGQLAAAEMSKIRTGNNIIGMISQPIKRAMGIADKARGQLGKPAEPFTAITHEANANGHRYNIVVRLQLAKEAIERIVNDPSSVPRFMACFPRPSQGALVDLVDAYNKLEPGARKQFLADKAKELSEQANDFVNTKTHLKDGVWTIFFGKFASAWIYGHQNINFTTGDLKGYKTQLLVATTTPQHAFGGSLIWMLVQRPDDPEGLYLVGVGAGKGWGIPVDSVNNNFVKHTWQTSGEAFAFYDEKGIAGLTEAVKRKRLREEKPITANRLAVLNWLTATTFGTWLNMTIRDWLKPEWQSLEDVLKGMQNQAVKVDAPCKDVPPQLWKTNDITAIDQLKNKMYIKYVKQSKEELDKFVYGKAPNAFVPPSDAPVTQDKGAGLYQNGNNIFSDENETAK